MGEFVTEQSDAIYHESDFIRCFRIAVEFVYDAVSIYGDTIIRTGILVPRLRPNAIAGIAGDGTGISSKDDIYKVNFIVAIRVIF